MVNGNRADNAVVEACSAFTMLIYNVATIRKLYPPGPTPTKPTRLQSIRCRSGMRCALFCGFPNLSAQQLSPWNRPRAEMTTDPRANLQFVAGIYSARKPRASRILPLCLDELSPISTS